MKVANAVICVDEMSAVRVYTTSRIPGWLGEWKDLEFDLCVREQKRNETFMEEPGFCHCVQV
jgi:hypothetical protein